MSDKFEDEMTEYISNLSQNVLDSLSPNDLRNAYKLPNINNEKGCINMIIKTIVPKIGEAMYYLGKPVTNGVDGRIGSIIDIIEDGDHFILIMDVPCVYSKPNKDEYSQDARMKRAINNIP